MILAPAEEEGGQPRRDELHHWTTPPFCAAWRIEPKSNRGVSTRGQAAPPTLHGWRHALFLANMGLLTVHAFAVSRRQQMGWVGWHGNRHPSPFCIQPSARDTQPGQTREPVDTDKHGAGAGCNQPTQEARCNQSPQQWCKKKAPTNARRNKHKQTKTGSQKSRGKSAQGQTITQNLSQ